MLRYQTAGKRGEIGRDWNSIQDLIGRGQNEWVGVSCLTSFGSKLVQCSANGPIYVKAQAIHSSNKQRVYISEISY